MHISASFRVTITGIRTGQRDFRSGFDSGQLHWAAAPVLVSGLYL
jgi:hypothetical protein